MTEATPLQTQASLLAEAKRKQTERENGIRANAFKQGREAERNEQAAERARLQGQHEGEIKGVKQAHLTEIARAVNEHRRGSFWKGAAIGATVAWPLAFVAAVWLVQQVINPAFDAAAQMRAQSDITDAIRRERAQEPGS